MSEAELDRIIVALGDFADLKCPFTLGHSRAVAALAAAAATDAGLSADRRSPTSGGLVTCTISGGSGLRRTSGSARKRSHLIIGSGCVCIRT